MVDAAVLVAHDAPVSGGLIEDRSEDRGGGASLAMSTGERRQSLGAQQRRVTGHDEQVVLGVEIEHTGGERDAGGIAGAALDALLDELDRELGRELLLQRLRHALGSVAHDDDDPLQRERDERVDDVQEHRPPAQRMEDLRSLGAHARAFARGEDNCRQRAVLRHYAHLLPGSRGGVRLRPSGSGARHRTSTWDSKGPRAAVTPPPIDLLDDTAASARSRATQCDRSYERR